LDLSPWTQLYQLPPMRLYSAAEVLVPIPPAALLIKLDLTSGFFQLKETLRTYPLLRDLLCRCALRLHSTSYGPRLGSQHYAAGGPGSGFSSLHSLPGSHVRLPGRLAFMGRPASSGTAHPC
jgi:hypothetical protein